MSQFKPLTWKREPLCPPIKLSLFCWRRSIPFQNRPTQSAVSHLRTNAGLSRESCLTSALVLVWTRMPRLSLVQDAPNSVSGTMLIRLTWTSFRRSWKRRLFECLLSWGHTSVPAFQSGGTVLFLQRRRHITRRRTGENQKHSSSKTCEVPQQLGFRWGIRPGLFRIFYQALSYSDKEMNALAFAQFLRVSNSKTTQSPSISTQLLTRIRLTCASAVGYHNLKKTKFLPAPNVELTNTIMWSTSQSAPLQCNSYSLRAQGRP